MDFFGVRSFGLSILAAIPLCGLAYPQDPADAPAFSAADLDFFEAKIRPLLIDNCFECHASTSKKIKGEFKLDSYADLMHGGRSGVVVVPGDVEASALIAALRYEGEVQMPPSAKLEDANIALIEEWVRRKLPMPDASSPVNDAAAKKKELALAHWAFQPLGDAQPPAVKDSAWCANGIDRFVLARLEALGIPAPKRADRATLLRRLSFDLTGLPPTPEEIDRFAADGTSGAWEREVDRLLASPHYGERWGRAWLDLARYSDSNGLDENLAMSTAFRYRDWVVRALNADLSYDRFLTWQLAGDLLPQPENHEQLRDQLIATGFLVLGPKMLAEQDKEKLAFDVVDEQIDVAFRTFQGLTLGCARCHDHKFDPIAQREYTAVAGMFKSTATMANMGFVSRWNERELASKAEIEARHAAQAAVAEAKSALEKLRSTADDALHTRWIAQTDAYLLAATAAGGGAVIVEAEEQSRGNLIRDDSTYATKDVVIARTGSGGLQFSEYDLTFAAGGRQVLEVRMAAEEKRPMRVLLDGVVVFESALNESTGSWKLDGQRWFKVGALEVRSGRNVLRLERDGSVPHLDQLLLYPASDSSDGPGWPVENNPWAAGLAPALVRAWAVRLETAQHSADPVFGLWSRFAALDASAFEPRAKALVQTLREEQAAGKFTQNPLVLRLLDGLEPQSPRELAGRYQTLFSSVDADWRELRAKDPKAERLPGDGAEELRKLIHADGGLFHLSAGELEPLYPEASRAELVAARGALEAREHAMPPALETAPGVRDAEQIAGIPLMRRGNHLDKSADSVPRGVLGQVASKLESPSIPEQESGRLQLAQWMLDPEHPLTSRVMVNRLWQGHFGFGIVRTASNFGLRGDTPSHPELLDWLAREFVRQQWSLKSMHKLICMSSIYQSACDASADIEREDPTNRLLSHQNRRRLDAEEVRDGMLATSQLLDPALGGSLLEIGNGDYVTNDQSKDSARYDAPRRSIYLPIIRNSMLDLFSAFDYPDPSVTVEQRPATTSPNQALYLMNSPFVTKACAKLARQAIEATSDSRARVANLYRAVHARAPTVDEASRALGFIARATEQPQAERPHTNVGLSADPAASEGALRREGEAWSLLAQVLLISNEFLYVD